MKRKKKYQYLCVEILSKGTDTEKMLNDLAAHGWRVKVSYAYENRWLILEKKL